MIATRADLPARSRGSVERSRPNLPNIAHAWLLPLLLGVVAGVALGGAGVLLATQVLPAGFSGQVPVARVSDQNPDLSVILSDGLMTALVRQYIAQGRSPVAMEGAQVVSRDGSIAVTGNIPLGVGQVPGSIEVAPTVADGRLRMRVLGASLGPVRVPADLSGLLEAPINQHLDQITNGFNATVIGAHTGGDGLTITARVNQSLR